MTGLLGSNRLFPETLLGRLHLVAGVLVHNSLTGFALALQRSHLLARRGGAETGFIPHSTSHSATWGTSEGQRWAFRMQWSTEPYDGMYRSTNALEQQALRPRPRNT